MLNYLLFLSMVHEYAYFLMNIFGNRSIGAAHLTVGMPAVDNLGVRAANNRARQQQYFWVQHKF